MTVAGSETYPEPGQRPRPDVSPRPRSPRELSPGAKSLSPRARRLSAGVAPLRPIGAEPHPPRYEFAGADVVPREDPVGDSRGGGSSYSIKSIGERSQESRRCGGCGCELMWVGVTCAPGSFNGRHLPSGYDRPLVQRGSSYRDPREQAHSAAALSVLPLFSA